MARLSADERHILSMFRYKRPSGSATELTFIEAFLVPLGFAQDAYGNLHCTVGNAPEILFSSHVDTVHSTEGLQNLDYRDGILQLTRRERAGRSNCLGADDTAGIWLMVEMVKAKVPGHYIIHHAEEKGCVGSADLANNNEEFLRRFKIAIAFDRAGKGDVITHQMGRRCASDAFARSLAKQLGAGYRPDDTGSYTDTNEYAHLIPECTNISVGYRHQHSSRETQDVPFLIALRDTLIGLDWSALEVERDPNEVEDYDDFYGHVYGSNRYGRGDGDLAELCSEYPEIVADILESYGITRSCIMDEVSRVYGFSPRDENEYEPYHFGDAS